MTLAGVFEELVGPEAAVEFVAYDGSRAGVPGAEIKFDVRSPYAVSYLMRSPGSLGLARRAGGAITGMDGDQWSRRLRPVSYRLRHSRNSKTHSPRTWRHRRPHFRRQRSALQNCAAARMHWQRSAADAEP